ncbi:hypothetical protein M8J77_016556 [Diaphorina citri]|nr:hypothetical protein M8J77_016556 [Diaphorina citri]
MQGKESVPMELADAARRMRLDVICCQEPYTHRLPVGRALPVLQTSDTRVILGNVDEETGKVNTALVFPNRGLGCMALPQFTCQYFVVAEITGRRFKNVKKMA